MKKVLLFLSFVFMSLSMFAQNTPDLVCPTPYVAAIPLDATSAGIIWNSTSATSYSLQYRACADSAWTSVNNLTAGTSSRDTGYYVLRNLVACKCYVVRLRANCSATESSDWRVFEFKTAGCVEPCRAPLQLFAASRDSMASLNWLSLGAGRTYLVQWKSRADSVWQNGTSSTNSLTVSRLQPCTEYQFRVKTYCSATESSSFSEISKFKTLGCVAPCSTPRDIRVFVSNREAVALSWIATGASSYEVSYAVGDSAARTVTVTTNAFRLLNITTCKYYKFKVRSICGSNTAPVYSEWSTPISVLTEGCVRCESPNRLSFTATETGATVKWDTTGRGSMTYDIQWMSPRDSSWRTVSAVRGNQYNLTGLTTCTWYIVRVRANCTSSTGSVWGAPIRFQTKGCAAVCVAPKNLKVYIADTVGVISWIGASTASYRLVVTSTDGSFTREVTVTGNVYTLTGLGRCKAYKVQLKTVCSTTSTSAIVTTNFETKGCPMSCGTPREVTVKADSNKVTVKWANMNAVKYYVEYKLLADSTATWKRDSTTANSLIFSNLQTCKTYLIRVASVCSTGVSPYSNFTVTTNGCPTPCIAPRDFVAEIVNDTTASVKFNFELSQSYTVQYRVAGTATWTSIPVNTITAASLPVRITGLLKCTTYQWRVLRTCITTAIVESAVQSFTTKGCPTPCSAAPRDLVVTTSATDSAKLTWIMPTAGLTYEVRYGGLIDSAFLNATPTRLTTNSFTMRGLVNCRYYAVQVRSICPNGQTSDWVTKQFRLGTSCFGDDDDTHYISEFGIYPNPGTGATGVQVAYKLEHDAHVTIDLMNLQGQIVNRLDGGSQETGNYIQTLDNLSELHNGMYLVVISANGKVVNTQKWQKQ